MPFIKTGVGRGREPGAVQSPLWSARTGAAGGGRDGGGRGRLLTAADEGREVRQLHAMDRSGRFAAFTGSATPQWSGHLLRKSFSVAGNALAGPQVIEAVATAYPGQGRAAVRAPAAGGHDRRRAAGGDKRGRQSAALLMCTTTRSIRCVDLRVDDHADPLAELARLEGVARQSWIHFRRVLANRKEPHGVLDLGAADTRIADSIKDGYE